MSNIIPIDQVRIMANDATKSGMFPVKTKEQAFTLMLIAQSENIHPMSAFMKYDIIQGKPALKSTEILSRFQQSGGKVEWIETNDEKAVGKFSHPQGGSITIEWNIERAAKAQLTNKDNWKKHPAQMLRARTVSEAVRAIYPACLNSMYASEEVMDFDVNKPEDVDKTEIIEEVEVVQSEETVINDFKKKLARKLTNFGYTSAMIKDFAEVNNLSENVELLEALINDEEKLNIYLGEFENGN